MIKNRTLQKRHRSRKIVVSLICKTLVRLKSSRNETEEENAAARYHNDESLGMDTQIFHHTVSSSVDLKMNISTSTQ